MSAQPIRDRRSERHDATRQEILDAAWELVRREGLAALSLRELAGLVGMRAPSLYSYFDSKHEIYDAMFAEGARTYVEREAAIPVTGDTLRDVKAGLHFFIGFCTEDPTRYQLLFQRTIPGFEPSAGSFAIAVDGLEAMRRRLTAAGIVDPRAVDLLTAIGTGLTDQQISNDPGGSRWSRLADEAAEMFLSYASSKPTTRRGRS